MDSKIERLSPKRIQVDPRKRKVVSMIKYLEGNTMDNNFNNSSIDRKDLELIEQRLANKIDVSETKLSGKIDVVESKLTGKGETLAAKIDSQNKLLYWIMGIISAGIIVPLITAVIKMLFFR